MKQFCVYEPVKWTSAILNFELGVFLFGSKPKDKLTMLRKHFTSLLPVGGLRFETLRAHSSLHHSHSHSLSPDQLELLHIITPTRPSNVCEYQPDTCYQTVQALSTSCRKKDITLLELMRGYITKTLPHDVSSSTPVWFLFTLSTRRTCTVFAGCCYQQDRVRCRATVHREECKESEGDMRKETHIPDISHRVIIDVLPHNSSTTDKRKDRARHCLGSFFNDSIWYQKPHSSHELPLPDWQHQTLNNGSFYHIITDRIHGGYADSLLLNSL